jgi:lipopolysaccharide export system permease protein
MLRAHLGPFLFALSVLTGMLYVNTVARRLPELAGKGLSAAIFAKVMLLSLPHIVALTLPMAVLVAVLYAYSSLAADNEVTALKASGVNMLRLLVPILVAGAMLTAVMIWFNDRLLPETNHELKNLMANIAAKSPTLTLSEQVVQPIRTQDFRTRYYLRAGRIDHGSGRLRDVTIYDLSDGARRRTIYADSGRMGFNQDTTDLFLTLYAGEMYTVNAQQPGAFERVSFEEQRNVVRGAGTKWDLNAQVDYRSDREMSLAMLTEHVDSTRAQLREALRQLRRESDVAVEKTLRGPAAVSMVEGGIPMAAGRPTDLMPQYYGTAYTSGDEVVSQAANEIRAWTNRTEDLQKTINRYQVEYHKKYAIPFACIIFVLIGAPLAVRFPRGGAGMVIAISLTIFGIYYISLIGGESLGDDGLIEPFIGPWAPNFVFGLLALWGLTRIGRETSTTRGGDWDDLWRTTVQFLARPFRRRRGRRRTEALLTGQAEGGD